MDICVSNSHWNMKHVIKYVMVFNETFVFILFNDTFAFQIDGAWYECLILFM